MLGNLKVFKREKKPFENNVTFFTEFIMYQHFFAVHLAFACFC